MMLKAVFKYLSIAVGTVMFALSAITFAAPLVLQASGQAPTDIQVTVDDFRNFLGANNGVGGTFPGGRREITEGFKG